MGMDSGTKIVKVTGGVVEKTLLKIANQRLKAFKEHLEAVLECVKNKVDPSILGNPFAMSEMGLEIKGTLVESTGLNIAGEAGVEGGIPNVPIGFKFGVSGDYDRDRAEGVETSLRLNMGTDGLPNIDKLDTMSAEKLEKLYGIVDKRLDAGLKEEAKLNGEAPAVSND